MQYLSTKEHFREKNRTNKFIKEYDKTCIYFYNFYEQLFIDLKLYNFYRNTFEINI